jgi:hypothetical protein
LFFGFDNAMDPPLLAAIRAKRLAEMVERHCQLATRFADAFRAAGYPILDAILRIARAEGATSND